MLFDDEVVETEAADTQEQVSESLQAIASVAVPEIKPDDSIARNMRALREKSERAERERDEYARRLQELESKKQVIEEEEYRLGPDDIAEGKHLSAQDRKIKKLEKRLEEQQQQATLMLAESRLKTQYPDFDKVVTKQNIESLRDMYPEIAQTLTASSDLYATGVSAYTMIKKLGIEVEDVYQAEKAIAHKNAAKPRPLASVAPQQGDSPLTKANAFASPGNFSPELAEQLRKEMFEVRKGY